MMEYKDDNENDFISDEEENLVDKFGPVDNLEFGFDKDVDDNDDKKNDEWRKFLFFINF